jgi:hypothetical protein
VLSIGRPGNESFRRPSLAEPSAADLQAIKVEVFCLQLMRASAFAGIEPVDVDMLHATAYLVNALSPVIGHSPAFSEVLKRNGLPYIPEVQAGLDRLLLRRVVLADRFAFDVQADGTYELDLQVYLDPETTPSLFRTLDTYAEESAFAALALEVALGLAASDEPADVFFEDASYSNPAVSVNRLISVANAELGTTNLSAMAAEWFLLMTDGERLVSDQEQINLYMGHLQRLHAEDAGPAV